MYHTATEIQKGVTEWKQFLKTAAKVYSSCYEEQLLIHAQRPDINACATAKQWSQIYKRWVKEEARGIGLLEKTRTKEVKVKYVFDILDTVPMEKGAPEPKIWQLKKEHYSEVTKKLNSKFGPVGEDGNIIDKMMGYAKNAVSISYRDYFYDLLIEKEGSFIGVLRDDEVCKIFQDTLTASVQYMLLERCGFDADNYISRGELKGIIFFSNPEVLSYLGDAASNISKTMLSQIAKIARRSMQKEEGIIHKHEKGADKKNSASFSLPEEKKISVLQSLKEKENIKSQVKKSNKLTKKEGMER